MLAWIANLDFAGSASDSPPPPPAGPDESKGAALLIGAGCWIAPLIAAVLVLGAH